MAGRYWLAPVTLFLLQSSPVIGFGASLGEYEEQGVNCDGEVLRRERRKLGSFSAEGSGFVATNVRVAAHAGYVGAGKEDNSELAPPFQGFFGGIMAGFDEPKLAFLFGVSTAPGDVSDDSLSMSNRVLPLGLVRLGELNKVHFQVEVGGSPVPGAPPDLGRVGVGFRLGDLPRFGFRVDVGVSDFPLGDQENHALLHALVRFPMSRTFHLGALATIRDPAGANFGVFGQMRPR